MVRHPTPPPGPPIADEEGEESEDSAILRAHGLDPTAFSDVLRAHVVGHLLAGRLPEPVSELPPSLSVGCRLVARGEPLTVLEVNTHFALLAGADVELVLPTRDLVAAVMRASISPPRARTTTPPARAVSSTPPPASTSEPPSAPRVAGFPRGSLWRR